MQLAALALAALASAGAAPPTPADAPLAAFADYSHPEVTADNCKNKDTSQTICFIPAKTMGRYLIEVEAKATATGPDAVQAVAINGQGWSCGERQTKKGEWTSGPQTLIARCVVSVLNDTALQVVALQGVTDATMDPAGPKVAIRRLPWNGVLEAGNLQAGVKAAPGATAKPGPAK
jgi:hypothetical protein